MMAAWSTDEFAVSVDVAYHDVIVIVAVPMLAKWQFTKKSRPSARLFEAAFVLVKRGGSGFW